MLNYLLKDFKNIENYFHDENQYLNTIKYIIENGSLINSRNGNVYTITGYPMHFSLENDIIPIITTKKVAIKTHRVALPETAPTIKISIRASNFASFNPL